MQVTHTHPHTPSSLTNPSLSTPFPLLSYLLSHIAGFVGPHHRCALIRRGGSEERPSLGHSRRALHSGAHGGVRRTRVLQSESRSQGVDECNNSSELMSQYPRARLCLCSCVALPFSFSFLLFVCMCIICYHAHALYAYYYSWRLWNQPVRTCEGVVDEVVGQVQAALSCVRPFLSLFLLLFLLLLLCFSFRILLILRPADASPRHDHLSARPQARPRPQPPLAAAGDGAGEQCKLEGQ